MNHSVVEKIASFHNELLSMQRIGASLDLGFESSGLPLEAQLEQIENRLRLQIQQDTDAPNRIASDPDLPQAYRTSLATWIGCDCPVEALDAVVTPASVRHELHQHVGAALVQPLIVVSIAYAGFIYLCLHVAPKLEAVYAQRWEEPGIYLGWLITLREMLPFWGPLVPLVILVVVVWRYLKRNRDVVVWSRSARRYRSCIQTAVYAQRVAALLESGNSLSDALQSVGSLQIATSRDDALLTANALIVASSRNGGSIDASDPTLAAMPSLLRWALIGELDGESRASVLRQTGDVYLESAERQARRRRVILPIALGGGLGGIAVLAYGLSLFLPYAELLTHIAREQVK